MPEDPEDDEDVDLFRPVWETDEETLLEPPGRARPPRPPAEPDYRHPLLVPLARAQDAVARLEARAEAASPAIADGLRARISYREASGWLSHAHIWVHPHDLALRDHGLTGSYGAAFRAGRLKAEIPATMAGELTFDSPPSDIVVDQAIRLATLWRRLAELNTWRPLANTAAIRETLRFLGCGGGLPDAELNDWSATADGEPGPFLIRAGRAGRDWMNRPGVEPRDPAGIFLAACMWRESGRRRAIPLPFWCAPETRHHRLDLHIGLAWTAHFLDCVAAAAGVGLNELDRLLRAEEKGRLLVRTSRSRLKQALAAVLRSPIVTAGGLARTLDITPQAALGLLRQLVEARIIREITGRASWRAFDLV